MTAEDRTTENRTAENRTAENETSDKWSDKASDKWSDKEGLSAEPELRLRRFLEDRHKDEEEEADLLFPPDEESRPFSLRGALPAAISVVALAGFGAIIWFAYAWSATQVAQDSLPVVAAQDTPIKEKPESEGGLEVPYQDQLVLNDNGTVISDAQIEHLLPPPEEPMPFEEVVVDEIESHDFVAVSPDPAEALGEALGNEAAGQEVAPAPPVQEPLPTEPLITAAGPAEEGTSGNQATAGEDVPDEIEQVLKNLEVVDETASAVGGVPLPSAKPTQLAEKAKAETAPQAEKQVEVQVASAHQNTIQQQVAVPTDSGFLLQLSSVKSEGGARNEWSRLQKTYPALLGQMGLTVERAVVGGATYYRVLTGPFPTRDTANDLCAQLKASSQSCLVKKK